MIHDLYLRAHVVVAGEESEHPERAPKRSRSSKLWPDYALVWDTETMLDLEQTLNFGVWRFCQLEGTEYVAVQEGIFYRDGLAAKGTQKILAYKEKHLADHLADGADTELVVLSRAAFVEKVFWESVRAGALIVGFNLSFDISRIAVQWAAAHNGGFSFVLSQWSESHVNNIHRPRICVAPLNGVAEQFQLTAVRRKDEQYRWQRGRFLDLHTLAFALTDNSYSLAGAIKAFGSKSEKMEHEPTGLVTEKEIGYARQDVLATLGLLNALKHEYELHPISLLPDRAYSPASIGKAYLRAMGIVEPMRKFKDIPPKIHGVAMAAYYGGRAESRIRRWPVPVVPVDLTSEYPSVDALLGIWDVLTAARLTTGDGTEEVRALLAKVTLDDLFRPGFWKQLNFYARIVPEGDILSVRSVYDSKSGTCNIGLNALHWKQSMWIAGPDLVASVLLGSHIPKLLEAFRIVPEGEQRGLRPVKLRGAISVDPRKEDFFTRVIEYRKHNKANDRLQYFLRILANSTSYGTYLELNPVKTDPNNRPRITVFSGEHIFKQPAPDTIEQPGSFYFPLLGALITSGGRLLLAMIERCVRDVGGTYLCCDTDALVIVASKAGGTFKMPDGAPPIKMLSWCEVEQITRRFDSLSPYNRNIVPHLLRLTDENYDKNGAPRQLFAYSIAAKRYALYTTKCGQPYCAHRKCLAIVDPKAHGLIFFAPSEQRENGHNGYSIEIIANARQALMKAKSNEEIRRYEAHAALAYWTAWHELPVAYPRADSQRVPEHWRIFGSRLSPLTRSPRLAVNPPNAMLNYVYAILESEARLAASELGLDPGIGFLHSDTRTRDSLACDLMEPIRPKVDAFLLDWLRREPLQRKWFCEQRDGNCRLTSELAATLSETSGMWRQALGPLAEWIAHTLWSTTSHPARIKAPATRLTQRRKREEKGIPTRTPIAPVGDPLAAGRRSPPKVSWGNPSVAPKLVRLNAHDPIAQARRADTQQRQAAALKAWKSSDRPNWLGEKTYREKIQPRLAGVDVPTIMSALAVSESYATNIRSGRCIPHPRHWVNLAHLTGSHR